MYGMSLVCVSLVSQSWLMDESFVCLICVLNIFVCVSCMFYPSLSCLCLMAVSSTYYVSHLCLCVCFLSSQHTSVLVMAHGRLMTPLFYVSNMHHVYYWCLMKCLFLASVSSMSHKPLYSWSVSCILCVSIMCHYCLIFCLRYVLHVSQISYTYKWHLYITCASQFCLIDV